MQVKFWKHAYPTMRNVFTYSAITYLKIAQAWCITMYVMGNRGYSDRITFFTRDDNGAPICPYESNKCEGSPLYGYGARWHRYGLTRHDPNVAVHR